MISFNRKNQYISASIHKENGQEELRFIRRSTTMEWLKGFRISIVDAPGIPGFTLKAGSVTEVQKSFVLDRGYWLDKETGFWVDDKEQDELDELKRQIQEDGLL